MGIRSDSRLFHGHRGKIKRRGLCSPGRWPMPLWTAPIIHCLKESEDSPFRDSKPTHYLGTLPRGDTGWPQGTLGCCAFTFRTLWILCIVIFESLGWLRKGKDTHTTGGDHQAAASCQLKNKGLVPFPIQSWYLWILTSLKWKTRSEWRLTKTSARSIKKNKINFPWRQLKRKKMPPPPFFFLEIGQPARLFEVS